VLIAVGAGLLLWQLVAPDAGGDAHPGPAWSRVAPEKSLFTKNIDPIVQGAAVAVPADAAIGDLVSGRLDTVGSATVRFRMTRTLKNGQVFDAELTVDFERDGEKAIFDAAVRHGERDPVRYLVEVERGSMARVQVLHGAEAVDTTVLSVAADYPIGLGDLHLPDVMSLGESLGSGAIRVLGYQGGSPSRRLLVLEALFENAGEPVDTDDGRPQRARGTSALLWVNPTNLTLTCFRVFDAHDRLVRVVENFVYDESKPGPALQSFRAGSLVSGSHTVFTIHELIAKRMP